MSTPRRRAFTIVEMLVVIGILALLLGLLLPALSGVQRKSLKNREVNSLRQVGIAWQLYSNSSNDKLLPGYLEDLVQARWRVSYDFLDGSTITAALARPYTWRIMPYLDYNHEMIHGYVDEPDFNPLTMTRDMVVGNQQDNVYLQEANAIAYEPAFGYNAYYVGGWWQLDPGDDGPPRYRFFDARADVGGDGQVGDKEYANVVVRSASTIQHSSNLIVFAASSILQPGKYREVPNSQPGAHYVVPPYLGPDLQWSSSWGNPGGAGGLPGGLMGADLAQSQQAPNLGNPDFTWGNLDPNTLRVKVESAAPIGRYNGLIPSVRADGHTSLDNPAGVTDMRKWIDTAQTLQFTHEEG